MFQEKDEVSQMQQIKYWNYTIFLDLEIIWKLELCKKDTKKDKKFLLVLTL